MGDYLPQNGLSRFWGARHTGMQWTAALSLFVSAMFVHNRGEGIRETFAVLTCIASALGVIDILLFVKIEEPPVTPSPNLRLRKVLAAPFRRRKFRSFIVFSSFWHFATMVGSPFISLYLLTVVGMELSQMLILWMFSWIGGAVLGRRLGELVESHGNRPMLVLCTALKSTNMLALILVPAEPTIAFLILAPAFVLDALLNAGMAIATNGFLLKNSPARNRAMYIASGTAVAGMVGGVTSIAAGVLLEASEGWSFSIGSLAMGNFHLMFAASMLLRLASLALAMRVHEPDSRRTTEVVTLILSAHSRRRPRIIREFDPAQSRDEALAMASATHNEDASGQAA